MGPLDAGLFFILVPVVLGLLFGAVRAGSQRFVSVEYHIAYEICLFLIAWSSWGIGAKVGSIVLRPWRPSLTVVLLVGMAVGGFSLESFPRRLLFDAFEPYLVPGSHFPPFWPPENPVSWILFAAQGALVWVVLNLLDFRLRGVPRFGFAPGPEPHLPLAEAEDAASPHAAPDPAAPRAGTLTETGTAAARAVPPLARRLPAPLSGADILALEAEEHYTKVHTDRGATLLLMRFTDAIEAMEPQPGFRVHRSFWVSHHAVQRAEWRGRRLLAVLKNGLEVPVSRSFRVVVQGAGFLDREGRPTAAP
jgi:hypothetical protein